MQNYSGMIALVILLILLVVFIKYQANHQEEEEVEQEVTTHQNVVANNKTPLNLDDEDAVVASLIASIELRNETHKNVQVLSVRKVG